ncbi:ral guanine nucleotide dissociation stimulator-like [Tachypleus tridentatus]|uniref:ral guanine nucleotide dissociation stimulator-like n=1 Tax=Tachypleus tridentatus TaxID=6853 RepID=UPI003FD24A76
MNPLSLTEGQQPSWRLWGEEKTDQAVYSIYLKKVRYHPGLTDDTNLETDEIIAHLEWETVQVRLIKAGTLKKLVESLATESGELESTYVNIFLATYRTFANTRQVLTLLLERYWQLTKNEVNMKEDIRHLHCRTIIHVLHVWLDTYPEDFNEPPEFYTLQQLLEFGMSVNPEGALHCHSLEKLQKYKDQKEQKDDEIVNHWCSLLSKQHISCESVLPYNFLEIPEDHFASQLTWMDATLFKKLISYQCLGSAWSRRDRDSGCEVIPSSVMATVDQFNAVLLRVLTTVLRDPDMKLGERAKIVSKWIEVAQELRFLKNFSSLKAIISALQSNAVHRLKKVWLAIPREKFELFTELARIFSEENNYNTCRNLLQREGSAKFVSAVGQEDHQLQKALQKQMLSGSCGPMQGTIPYLGTFLTDLTMIDSAIPDATNEGLINFDKHRKEFEVLAHIRLLQSAANNYNIVPDVRFFAWFDSVPVINENSSYELSCIIEPRYAHGGSEKKFFVKNTRTRNSPCHKKTHSTSSTSTSSSNSVFCDQSASDVSMVSLCLADSKVCLSCSSLSLTSLTQSNSPGSLTELSTVGLLSPKSTEFYIIRVSLSQPGKTEEEGINVYKSIMLSNQDHTKEVIQNAMIKHGISGSPEDYSLAQLLPDGEIVFPYSANVFYAVNTQYDLNFILRPKINPEFSSNTLKKKSKKGIQKFRSFVDSVASHV